MLDLWWFRTLSFGVSEEKGKRGLVGSKGMGSTYVKNAPLDYCREFYDSKSFLFSGKLNDKNCLFKIDTGSDVSIVSKKLIKKREIKFSASDVNLKYPTGEDVPFEGKVLIKIDIGKYSLSFPVFVAKIGEDCLLGADFLRKINLENIFKPIFENVQNKKVPNCRRIKISTEEVPFFLKDLFVKDSKNLDSKQKKIFANILN